MADDSSGRLPQAGSDAVPATTDVAGTAAPPVPLLSTRAGGRKKGTVTVVIPWGASRMTAPLPEEPPLYETLKFDPKTQLTHFYDAGGGVVDMAGKVTVTKSKGGGGDGSSGSSSVADDSNNDG
ncbi:putative ATP-grasp-modified RiPP [Streptosporangium sp. NPDC000396]|uniref:putative ATP-grasp-modified RiPP n=1 Tax=Streptosporangium sp. NPDC000396 TaxID=3366185 RepID=UPI0036D16D03